MEVSTHDGRRLTAAGIARRAALPVAPAHRLVAQLTDVGFLDAHRRAPGGHRPASVGVRRARALDLREAAMPFLEDIHAATRQHTQLDGTDVLVVE
ncbi:helix-turn-helix domain-containing protein [Streptomyces sp. NPDC047841]|uniref:helix-turn-helix domain-containing protein n=1 Tax=Streptomyces sp. NPDC047841 TaxID=3154708 RepID=UPI003451EF26